MKTLAEMSWVDAEQALAKAKVAIIPVGAVEVYGPHLPQGSDGFAALEVAERLAGRVDAVVTPLVPVGCSQMMMSFAGTLAVRAETLKRYLDDLCGCLVHWGIQRMLFINGHGGNVPVVDDLCREYVAKGIKCAQIDWWRAVAKVPLAVADSGDLATAHAGEYSTSVLMAVRSDLVDSSRFVRETLKPGLLSKYPEVIQYDIPFREMTESGVAGDPTTATREKGELLIEKCLDRVVAFLNEWN